MNRQVRPGEGTPAPRNTLLPAERAIIAEVVARRDLADCSCHGLSFWVLEHYGRYISPVAFWRSLKARGASGARVRRVRRPSGGRPDTAFALKPNALWCWDITHLRTVVPWQFFYLYVLLDWVSRKVVAWLLAETGEPLRTETYRAQPVRRVLIPKPDGTGERPLGIPVIRDRVVQTARRMDTGPERAETVGRRRACTRPRSPFTLRRPGGFRAPAPRNAVKSREAPPGIAKIVTKHGRS